MLTVTINQDVLERELAHLARIHRKSLDAMVTDALACQLGLHTLLDPQMLPGAGDPELEVQPVCASA